MHYQYIRTKTERVLLVVPLKLGLYSVFCLQQQHLHRVIKSVSWPGAERVNEQLCPQFISILLFIFLHRTESG